MRILIVDDNPDSRIILRKTLESDGYTVTDASNGAEALKAARELLPDMIISDILMPVMDGFQLCRECKSDERLRDIPFIFYSAAYTDKKDEEFGLSMGAERFIMKPMNPFCFLEIIENILKEYEKETVPRVNITGGKDEGVFLREYNERLIMQLEKKVADLEESNKALSRSEGELKDLFESFVRTMVNALDAKSRWTRGHSERVAAYSEQIAAEIGLGGREIKNLRLAALLHDIGKIGLRDYLLDKESPLTDEEFEAAKKHAALGAEILEDIKQLKHITPSIRHHHERIDGKGYPDGLKGDEINLYARILHVADSFDSMTADRPYRRAPGVEYAVSEFRKHAGRQFEPRLVKAFLRVLSRKYHVTGTYKPVND